MAPKLFLIRGLPGSGKSTFAQTLSESFTYSGCMTWRFEADMFFVDPVTEKYNFNPKKLGDAHRWCRELTEKQLEYGDNVIVSNTFTTKSELEPYFKLAKKYGAKLTVITMNGNYGSIHNVPEAQIERMRNRFEHDISDLYELVK